MGDSQKMHHTKEWLSISVMGIGLAVLKYADAD
jgi:hypothetical protein